QVLHDGHDAVVTAEFAGDRHQSRRPAGHQGERAGQRGDVAAQGVLGVYIGTMVQQDALSALRDDWAIVLGVAIGTLVLSV
ncbi:hypothetical protein C6A88_00400, partial [Mycolicibacterium austroafricanum]